MFGKTNVLRDGVQGRAVILDARPGNVLSGHGERLWHLQVRVHFEDGQTGDVWCDFYDLTAATVGQPSGIEPYPLAPGVVVPVRYDPNNPAKVEIDRPRIIADTISAYDADRAKKIERADRQLAGAAAPPQHSAAPQRNDDTDEAYLFDALTQAQTRGDDAEVQRLTGLIENLLSAEERK